MQVRCPGCEAVYEVASVGTYSCDRCKTEFSVGATVKHACQPVSQPQPIVNVSAMNHWDVNKICSTMWVCTMWLIFAPVVISALAMLVMYLVVGGSLTR